MHLFMYVKLIILNWKLMKENTEIVETKADKSQTI